jgi:hypothetical protein
MGKVLELNSKLAAKKNNEETKRLKKFFLDNFGDQPKHVMDSIAKAIIEKDEKKYFEITNPILMRKAMIEVNQLRY